MNTFYYKAVNLDGKKIRGFSKENSVKNIQSFLKNKGYFLVTAHKIPFVLNKITLKEMLILLSKLDILLNSGIIITEALDIIYSGLKENSLMKDSIKNIKDEISKGSSIYKSFNKFDYLYPQFFLAMILIGEESGELPLIFKKLHSFYQNKFDIKKSIKGALLYPLIMIATFIMIMLVTIYKIIPIFEQVFKELGEKFPIRVTYMLWGIKTVNFVILILIISLILIIKLEKAHKLPYKILYNYHYAKLNVPIIKDVYSKSLLCIFSNQLYIMLNSGINISKVLDILQKTTHNEVIKEKIYLIEKFIKEGFGIYDALVKSEFGFKNNLFLSMIKVGEDTGKIEESLLTITNILKKDIEGNIKTCIKIIEPIVIIFMAIIIVVFFIQLFMPVVNVVNSIN